MPLSLVLLNNTPYTSKPLIAGMADSDDDNYDISVNGFGSLVAAAKEYFVIDALLNDDILGKTNTVALIFGRLSEATTQKTKDVINTLINLIRPIIDEYAVQLRDKQTTSIIDILKSKRVFFKFKLDEITTGSLLCTLCRAMIPYTLVAKYFKYEKQVNDMIQDVIYYLMSLKKPELGHNLQVNNNMKETYKISPLPLLIA